MLKEKTIHGIFIIGLMLKGLNALIEIAGGILFLFRGALSNIIIFLTKGELIEDPSDFLANYVRHFIPYLSVRTELFGAIYLLSHGIIKIILIAAILRNKLWAYPATLIFLSLFVIYQLYKYLNSHSLFMLFLAIFDLVLIGLTWHEYAFVRNHRKML